MINKNMFMRPLLDKKNTKLNSSLLFISIAIGASVGYYLLKKYAFNKKINNRATNFRKPISDVRTDIKNASANLLGDLKDRNDPTQISVPEAGTLNWRKNREKSMFPPIPDPNIKIN